MTEFGPTLQPSSPDHPSAPAGQPGPPTEQGGLLYQTGGPPPRGPAKRKRWPFVATTILVVLVIGIVICFRINLPYFALVPGQAQAVGPLLSVPADQKHSTNGQILLTDVGVADVTVGNWLYYKLNSNAVLQKKSGYIQPGTNESEYDAEGPVEMTESQLTAAAVSLRQLGYDVTYHDAGVLIWAIEPGTDAYNVLQIGQVITAVDSTPTPNVEALSKAMTGRSPGQKVTLTLGSIVDPQKGHNKTVTLTSAKSNGKTSGVIGVDVFTQPGWTYPFKVSVSLNNIGGPSAGLAFTLGLLDTLSGGDLTGGKTIAATGTICADGTVGEVGGVPQKTVAVENAHASVFFVPEAELSQAKQKANSSLHVFGVSNLSQALHDLESLGGKLGKASNGPPAGAGGHSIPTDQYQFPCGY
jgi:Lon-like protease